jgi:hypothetical protein
MQTYCHSCITRTGGRTLAHSLPAIRSCPAEHYDFPGYITGSDPVDLTDRHAPRTELGYHPGRGGLPRRRRRVRRGAHLLRRVVEAFPLPRARCPSLRMVVVTSPRIDPATLHGDVEQTFHVRHRLERCGAGRPMDFALDGPEQIVAAITGELGRPVAYRPVDVGGAARAAALIGELL